MLQHNNFDDYEIAVSTTGNVCCVHMPCNTTIVDADELYLSAFTRAAITHTQVCEVVNSIGKHAGVN